MKLKHNKLLNFGITGAVIAALCCFTPIISVVLGVVGLSAVVGYLDFMLLPVLVFFVGLLLYAVWKRSKT